MLVNNVEIFMKKRKTESANMVANNIKIYSKMKNKDQLIYKKLFENVKNKD